MKLPRRDGSTELSLQFENFNDLMTFVGVSRRLSHYPDCIIQYPATCTDPDLYKDVYSLLYLFKPDHMNEAISVYQRCCQQNEAFGQWVREQFNLSVSQCRNLHILNEIEEVEELITEDFTVLSSELYLKPHYIEVRVIPQYVLNVVREFQQLIQPDIYGRLVQVCQFSYPSPLPLVRAILDLYNGHWARMFDDNPYAFLKAIRESTVYRKESYMNRSYRRPNVSPQRINVMLKCRG